MKTLTVEELRKMDTTKLVKECESARKALNDSTFAIKNVQSKSVHEIRLYRKYIAKIETIIKELQHAN